MPGTEYRSHTLFTNRRRWVADRARRTVFLLFAVLGLTFIARTDGDAKEVPVIIGFPEDNMANDWRAAQMREIQKELSKHPNIRFLQADAGGQVARNIQDIEDMVDAGAKLLFLGPRNESLLTPVVQRMYRKGIHIVLLTRRINSEDFDTFISPNDFMIAHDAAIFLAKHLKGKGRVLMLEGVPTATTAIQRSAGFKAGLAEMPGVKLAAARTGNYTRAGGIAAVESALDDGVIFDAIFSHNDAMAIGARLALRAHGIDPKDVPTVGIDYIPEARKAIRDGEQLASFTYPTCGKAGVKAALAILRGETVARHIEIPSQVVTKSNVETVRTVY